MFLEI